MSDVIIYDNITSGLPNNLPKNNTVHIQYALEQQLFLCIMLGFFFIVIWPRVHSF